MTKGKTRLTTEGWIVPDHRQYFVFQYSLGRLVGTKAVTREGHWCIYGPASGCRRQRNLSYRRQHDEIKKLYRTSQCSSEDSPGSGGNDERIPSSPLTVRFPVAYR